MNKKLLLGLLGISSLVLAGNSFDLSKNEPLKLELETKATVGNFVIGKEFDITNTFFEHENKLGIEVYEFAKVTGKLTYAALKNDLALLGDKTGVNVELDFKNYGKVNSGMLLDKTFTLGHNYSRNINSVKVLSDLNYRLSNDFTNHNLDLGLGAEYSVNKDLNLKGRAGVLYSTFPGTEESDSEIKETRFHLVVPAISAELNYSPVKNLGLAAKGEVKVPVILNPAEVKVLGKVAVEAKYDITKELSKVDNLVITPNLKVEYEHIDGSSLSINPVVNLNYKINKNLELNANASSNVLFGTNESDNKFGYAGVVPKLESGLKYTW